MDLTSVRLLLILGLVVAAQAQNCERPVPGANMGLKDDSILLETFLNGAVASFRCDVGYTSVGGSSSVTCGDGSWSPVKLKCERKSCGSAGEVDHGNVDYPKGNQFGDKAVLSFVKCDEPVVKNGEWVSGSRPPYKHLVSVTFECDTGYDMVGERTQTCDINDNWSPGLPECIKKGNSYV
ncbi:complement decay-accelerating factor-like [Limanda limanda]|uniref:complement decay-accelerating factor-like n=1 Tax=Limanda limanda TaxID=27771 RepID=UPI0029C6DC8A|nr:complement decay-accelerating factor-like [Limanda limanda]